MRRSELFSSHFIPQLITQTCDSCYLRSPIIMNAMTSPYNAMASTSAKPIHIYFPTRPSASGWRATASIIFPKMYPIPTPAPANPLRPSPCPIMLLLLNPLYLCSSLV